MLILTDIMSFASSLEIHDHNDIAWRAPQAYQNVYLVITCSNCDINNCVKVNAITMFKMICEYLLTSMKHCSIAC
jgi:hypothetical protein